jgi:ribose/xylose/arabinose/galactoside ABC-type transport system permease subunit
MSFLSTAWARLQAETPTFFKKVRTWGQSLMATGTAATASQIVPNIKVPAIIVTLGTHCIVAGFIMTLVASFACKDPNDAPQTAIDPNQSKKP